MNYSKILEGAMNVDVSKICVNIIMLDIAYPFAFIEHEDDSLLGIFYTTEDGTERFAVVNKEEIVSVEVVYEQDLQNIIDAEAMDDSMFL